MPFLLPAAATAMAAAAPAVAASTAAATAGATLTSIATNIAMNVAISAVMSALQPPVGAAGRSSEWTLSPDGPIPFAAGRIGVAGAAVHRATFGPDLMYLGVPGVLSGAGPIDAYESFRADEEFVAFDGNGKAISSQYAGELWFRRTFGAQPDVAVASPPGLKNGAALPGWGAQHKLSGKAAYMVVMGENSKGTAFPTGEIKPLIVIRGLKGWDPRLDSTYPGGVGPCRLDNPATWVYLTNPILWGLKWSLGLWEGPTLKGAPAHGSATDYQVGGIGAKLSGIDVGAFVACANVADANGWTVCAYPTTDDDKHAVLTSFLQAGGAIYASRAGKISCIQRAAPRASVVTISAADTAGPLEIDTAASRIDRINTIRPRCMSENHRWQLTAIPEVTAQAYRDEDGGTRPRGIDYTYVSDATQAAQLAALQIANTREGIAGIIPLKPHLQKIKPGDAFTITEPGFVLNGLKCLCLSTDFDPTTKIVAVSFVSETDAKYPFALGQSQDPPEAPVLEPVDPRYVSPPGETEWTVVPRPPSAGGAQIPGFDLVGEVDNATATALLVEWGPTDAGPWTQAYLGPPTAERVPLTGVQPNAVYYVSTMNIRGQNYSERRVFGPFTAPALVSDDTINVGDRPAGDVAAEAAQVPGLALTLAGAQIAIAQHEATLNAATTGLVDKTAAILATLNTPTTGVVARLTATESQINTPTTGLVARLAATEAAINTPTTGLLAINAQQQQSIVDLTLGKAEASTVTALIASARLSTAALLPFDFQNGGSYFVNGYGGIPSGRVPLSVSPLLGQVFADIALEGRVLRFSTVGSGIQNDVMQLGDLKMEPGRRYKMTVRGRCITACDGSQQLAALGIVYANGVAQNGVGDSPEVLTQNVWKTVTWTFAANDFLGYSSQHQTGARIRGFGTFELSVIKSEDVTDVLALDGRVLSSENAITNLQTGKADASRVALVEARASGLAGTINGNTGFDEWPVDLSRPTLWAGWDGGVELTSRVADGIGGYALRQASYAGGQSGLVQYTPVGSAEPDKWYVLDTEIELSAGTLQGAGVLVSVWDNAVVTYRGETNVYFPNPDVDGVVVGDGVVGRRYRHSTMFKTSAAGNDVSRFLVYPMAHWSGFGGSIAGANAVIFRNINVRRATAGEIEQRVARGGFANLSARYAAVEQATSDLNTGKASVARVATLEARAGGANLFKRSQFRSLSGYGTAADVAPWTYSGDMPVDAVGVYGWSDAWAPPGESPLVSVSNGTGSYFDFMSELVPVIGGKRYCASVFSGLYNWAIAGYSRIFIEWRDQANAVISYSVGGAGSHHYVADGSFPGGPALSAFKRIFEFSEAPANAATAKVFLRRSVGQANSYVWFTRPMLSEATALQTEPPPWSSAALEARVTSAETATATLEGRLESRALLQVVAGNQVAGMQALAVSGPDASYSAINFWAGSFQVSNNGSAAIAPFEVRDNVVRMREAIVDRLAVNTTMVVGERRLRVAVQPFPVACTDGVPISFGYPIGDAPEIVFLRDGPISQPGAGESFNFYAESPTGTGFIPRLKITTAGTPSNQAQGPGGVTNDGTRLYFTLAAAAANNTVNVRVTGAVQSTFENPQYNPGGPIMVDDGTTTQDGYLVLRIWTYAGGWTPRDTIFVGPNYRTNQDPPGTYNDAFDITQAQAVDPSVTHVGVSLEYESHAGSYLTDLRLAYQTVSSSGTRSATPSGQLTTAMIYPKTGA
jgi:hypothetical protein